MDEFSWYAARSGLASGSLADHMYAYLRAQTGLDNTKSLSDLLQTHGGPGSIAQIRRNIISVTDTISTVQVASSALTSV